MDMTSCCCNGVLPLPIMATTTTRAPWKAMVMKKGPLPFFPMPYGMKILFHFHHCKGRVYGSSSIKGHLAFPSPSTVACSLGEAQREAQPGSGTGTGAGAGRRRIGHALAFGPRPEPFLRSLPALNAPLRRHCRFPPHPLAEKRGVLPPPVEAEEEEEDRDEDQDEIEEEEREAHVAVLKEEVVAAFHGCRLCSFVDCTLGAAGHASAIIVGHPELRTFVGFDVDPNAHLEASPRLQEAMKQRCAISDPASDLKLHLLQTNFKNIRSALEKIDPNLVCKDGVDGVLMDLGMSSMQLNVAQRGFGMQHDGPVDMRMDPSLSLTAAGILNDWPESEVGRILRDYGEESRWKHLARKIIEARFTGGGIHTTVQLLDVIQRSTPARFQGGRQGWKKTAIRVFQALRIVVNNELATLEKALSDAHSCLASKGRLAVISFHSLEDRIVKQFFLSIVDMEDLQNSNQGGSEPIMEDKKKWTKKRGEEKHKRRNMIEGRGGIILTKRPIIASDDEIKVNRRSRSAKLRIFEKK